MLGQSFAAADGFAMRPAHRDALVVKPGYPMALEGAAELVFRDGLNGFAAIMQRQRIAESELSKEDTPGIGGEVHFVEITTGGIAQFLAHRFDDYHQMYESMLRKFQRL